MAKRSDTRPAPEDDDLDRSLAMLAEMLLSEHFFVPEQEHDYKKQLSDNRPSGTAGLLLNEETVELTTGPVELRIEALKTWTHFRIRLTHPTFNATVEGAWSFADEVLNRPKVSHTGDCDTIGTAVDELMGAVETSGLDDDEFADFIQGLDDEDDEEVPLIGDDPTEPPEATSLDRNRIKAIAKRLARKPDAELNLEDRGWLEQMPQTLPVILQALVDAAGAAKRDETLVLAYQYLLGLQLEFVRYRQDRGWDWADAMLTAFQNRLITLGSDSAIPRDDWFMMCNALTEARVKLSESTQVALADAGFQPDEETAPPEQMMQHLRGFMDELAKTVSSPFEVIMGLQNASAMVPPALRGFMATEFALSPHAVLRDAVPLLLLDEDASVRQGATAALDQTAHPDTMSPDTLRRVITIRNWIPAIGRPALDAVIRKARLAGVETGAWPAPIPDLEFHASTIDGSGAQNLFAVGMTPRKGFFAGLLLRLGVGVVDTWADLDLSRGKINKLLREAQSAASVCRVDKPFADTLVQHAIATAVQQDATPPSLLLEMAEWLGGAEWKDRSLDIKAEADRLFAQLAPADRTPQGIEAGFVRGMNWLTKEEVFGSWFEEGPHVQKALAKLARTDRIGMTAVVMTDILPAKRADWAERFLVMALWSQASADAKQHAKARDLVLIAHALAGDTQLGAIPVMGMIAVQTVQAMLMGAW
ncbi:MAG TPA: hypothetical protein VFG12_06345 [Rhodopila sp.]|jgi:hypothetical protein|nr:hypothetical protein [Rhodopila sp.]